MSFLNGKTDREFWENFLRNTTLTFINCWRFDHSYCGHHQNFRVCSIVEHESDWRVRKTKEAIHIRLQGAVMNRDQGTFLSGIYDPLFADLRKIGEKSRRSEPRLTSLRSSQPTLSSSDDDHSEGGRNVNHWKTVSVVIWRNQMDYQQNELIQEYVYTVGL